MSDDQFQKAEITELRETVENLEHQIKNLVAERDLLAVMLNEAENAQRRQQGSSLRGRERPHAAGEFEHDPATIPSNGKVTLELVLKLIEQISPQDRDELERRLRLWGQ